MTLKLRSVGASDRGLIRSGNQDAQHAGAWLVAVADGMGGMAAGDLASRIAIDAVAAETTRTSVSTVSVQSPWLMMKRRPTTTPSASFHERFSAKARAAMARTTTTGGNQRIASTRESRTARKLLEMESKNQAKLSIR